MKTTYSLITLLLLFCLPGISQNTFNWNDSTFSIGAVRNITIIYDYNTGGIRHKDDTLTTLATFLKKNPHLKIEIACHTDFQRPPKVDQQLSERHAIGIAYHLISLGVDSLRIIHKGYGDTQPIISAEVMAQMKTNKEKEAAYQANRRTEVRILAIDFQK